MYISDILRIKGSTVTTIIETESIEQAVKRLRAKQFGSLVVLNHHGKLSGIITERDIIRGLAEKGLNIWSYRVEDLMTFDVITRSPTHTLQEVMEVMTLRKLRHVPIVDEKEELCGIISSTDIVKFRLHQYSQEIKVIQDITRIRK